MNTTFWKVAVLWLVIGLIVGLLVGMAIGWRLDKRIAEMTSTTADTSATADETATTTNASTITAVVNDQPAGRGALIANITLPRAAWITVRDILPSGDLGNILGATRRDAGSYTNLVVNLLRGTVPNTSYAVVLYEDNGQTFNPKTLVLIPGADGKPATTDFKATTPLSPSGQ